jgi:tetratricopeptide (TPR) repeat protein
MNPFNAVVSSRAIRMAHLLVISAIVAISPINSAQTAKAPDYSAESLIIENVETTYRYNQDGTGEKLSSVRIHLQTEAGARQFSVLSVPFASANEKPAFVRLVVKHSDGTTTETPASDAMEMPAPVTQQAPLYSDLKMLQVPVRGLRSGDTLEYAIRVERKNPEAPSQFWDIYQFSQTFVVLSETLTLDIPATKFVQQWSASVKPEVTEKAGRKIFAWHSSHLKPTSAEKKDEDEPETNAAVKADVAWSTFRTWAEVGEWYRALAASRAVPNDAVRAQADEITRDAKTPAEQAQALYTFVSSRIRYVGIDFGVGRFQPHTAAEVLTSRYGDCKDKDTLFEALLRAKGISASPALIGVNLELVGEVPSPSWFNHVITAIDLPSGRAWADTTPGVAPFQMLVSPLRGKRALVISQGTPALDTTPASPPFAFEDQLRADGTLSKDGEFTGKVDLSFRSDTEILVRAIASNLAPAQWDQGAQMIANGLGFTGKVSNSRFEKPDELTQPMHVAYDYSKKPLGDWDNFRFVPFLPVLTLPQAPEKQPARDIDLGSPRTEKALSRIHLPAGFGADLPNAVHAKSQFVSIDITYRLENGDLIVERLVVVTKSKVPPTAWEEYRKFAKDSGMAEDPWIQLNSTNATESGPRPPKPGEINPAAAALIDEVGPLENRKDFEGAAKKLDEARKLNPEQPYLWSNYGWLAMVQNRPEEAAQDFRHELEHHPDETFVVTLFAGFLMRRSQMDEARSVLEKSFQLDPSHPDVAGMLAALQAPGDPDKAVATLKKALQAKPDDPGLMTQLVPMLLAKGDKAEARKTAEAMLQKAGDDPLLLNNAAYSVAVAEGDLEAAEKAARKSLDVLDSQTSPAQVGEANAASFMRSSSLVATWDTLGYILFKENKMDEALDYLEAAWHNGPNPVISAHYGQALEAAGKKSEASRVLSLSGVAGVGNPEANGPALVKRADAAKKASERQAAMATREAALQQEHTFKIALPSTCKSFDSATYRLQISSSSAPEFLQVGGQQLPDGAAEALKTLKLPHLVPSASKSKIIRDAVVSCSAQQASAYVVLMPLGGIEAEQARR